jgi:ferric-dicitrate binding protein FerR (iron transport regulator)
MRRARLIAIALLLIRASVLGATALAATVDYAEDMTSCGYTAALQLADGSTLRLRLALSDADKQQGLSRLR